MGKPRFFDLAATDRYLRTRQAAAYIGVAESTLIGWRREKRGPPPIRVSANRCLYDRLVLDAFMKAHTGLADTPQVAAQRAAGAAAALKVKKARQAALTPEIRAPNAERSRP